MGFSWRSLRGRGGGRHCGQKQQRGGGARVASEHFWKAFWIFLSNGRRYSGIPYCSEFRVRSFRTRCLVSILLFVASYLHAAKNIRQAPQKCAKRAQRTLNTLKKTLQKSLHLQKRADSRRCDWGTEIMELTSPGRKDAQES